MEWLSQIWPIVAMVGVWILLQVLLRKAGVPT
jgi:hypothetical protein